MRRIFSMLFLKFVVLVLLGLMATPVLGQYLNCTTVATTPDSLQIQAMGSPYTPSLDSANVALYFHILRNSDGSGGLSSSTVDSLLHRIIEDFYPLNIYFGTVEWSNLDNSTYYADPIANVEQIFSSEGHVDGIDIYLGPRVGAVTAKAKAIPSTSLLMTGDFNSYQVLSHVLGHCLGLYDTDETVIAGASSPGTANGYDGDMVSDTYSDPGLMGLVDENCSLDASIIAAYSPPPDPGNIMSGGRSSCWVGFSAEQGSRILTTLTNIFEMEEVVDDNDGPYDDKSGDTNIRQLVDFPIEPINGVVFDFIGSIEKDMLVTGYYDANPGLNRGSASKQVAVTVDGVPVFNEGTDDAFVLTDRPQNGTSGLIAADYDNDGDIDFYAPNPIDETGYSHRLYRNTQGDDPPYPAAFEDVTVSAGLYGTPNNGHTINGSWGDYDGDGDVDLLIVAAYDSYNVDAEPHSKAVYIFENDGGVFVQDTSTGIPTVLPFIHTALWADFDQDHDLDLVLMENQQDSESPESRFSKYYLNTGGGYFLDYTSSALPDHFANWENSWGFAAVADMDNDGDLDIAYRHQTRVGWFSNNAGVLSAEWSQEVFSNHANYVQPRDVDVFDYDLDGDIDMLVANYRSVSVGNENPQYIYINQNDSNAMPPLHINTIVSLRTQTRGIVAADFTRDGYTDLYASVQLQNAFFYKAVARFDGTVQNNWIGITLAAENGSCNYRGIGATVTLFADNLVVAQVVDGGSGNAGQHDLDLVFGLGGRASVDSVLVSWPCYQDQVVHDLTIGEYNTISLDFPATIETDSVRAYLQWVPAESITNWVFEWKTDQPTNNSMDRVELVRPVEGVSWLYPTAPGVEHSVSYISGKYLHRIVWRDRPCAEIISIFYKVHSQVLTETVSSLRKELPVFFCPMLP